MTIKNIFIMAAAIFSLHISAAQAPEKKFDQERYIDLNRTFNEQNNTFIQEASNKAGTRSWIIDVIEPDKLDADIETIKEHKKQKENEHADRKFSLETSWKPLILKLLGGVFGISAAASGAITFPSILLKTGIVDENPYPIALRKIISYPLYYGPNSIIGPLIISPLFTKIQQLYNQDTISGIQFDVAFTTVQLGRTLLFAGITKYLLNKAASYANEITKLEKIIARDQKMITALEKIKESKSENN